MARIVIHESVSKFSVLVTTFSFVVSQQKLIANLLKKQNDGTVEVDLEKSAPAVSELLELQSFEESTVSRSLTSDTKKSAPWLQIAILVVGTRGDVQPFLAIAKKLQACLNISFQFILVKCQLIVFFIAYLVTQMFLIS